MAQRYENYTFLTPNDEKSSINVDAGREGQDLGRFSNAFQRPPNWEDLKISPNVYDTLRWLGVNVLHEQEWEFGLYSVLEEMTPGGQKFPHRCVELYRFSIWLFY